MASFKGLMRISRISQQKLALPLFNRSCTCQRAQYHSYEHPSPPPFSTTADSILSAAIKHVPETGFTETALQLGAKDAGFMSISTNLFPRGVFDLIAYYLATKRLALKDTIDGENGFSKEWAEKKAGVGSRVRSLLLRRLQMNHDAGIIQKWPEALAIMAQPSYVPQSISELGKLSDEIWFLAGDVSVDTSWYTKRATLSAIYAASEVFQTQDTSPDYKETERFVDSRLQDLKSFGDGLSSTVQWVDYTAHSFINVLRSKGFRI